jgi:hypothetical protein
MTRRRRPWRVSARSDDEARRRLARDFRLPFSSLGASILANPSWRLTALDAYRRARLLSREAGLPIAEYVKSEGYRRRYLEALRRSDSKVRPRGLPSTQSRRTPLQQAQALQACVATRFDKLARNYLAPVTIAATRLWTRAYESTT